MAFKRIQPGISNEANKIHEWVEGVIAAFKEGYLQQVSLQAYSQLPRRELLEVYSFSVSMGAGGVPVIAAKCIQNCMATQTQKEVLCISSQQVDLDPTAGCDNQLHPSSHLFSKEQLRTVIGSMLHDLVVALESMPIPDTQRCISMRITYNDEVTPPDYEPPHFAPVSRQQVLSDIARERLLSVARHCDGASGFHKVDIGVLYQPPPSSQELNSADFYEDGPHAASSSLPALSQQPTTYACGSGAVLGGCAPRVC